VCKFWVFPTHTTIVEKGRAEMGAARSRKKRKRGAVVDEAVAEEVVADAVSIIGVRRSP
jgi:hypothetical protein